VIIAPFALPGEIIRIQFYRSSRLHSFADLLEVVSPNLDLRGDSRAMCCYFGQCSGSVSVIQPLTSHVEIYP
jgi:tRNA (uracil-5-)-methyltransferase